MNLSGIKLAVTDIDGTLLNSKGILSDEFYPLFHQLKAKGILFAAASGRQFFNLQNRFADIQQDMLFIAENGSYVVYQDQDILVQDMDAGIVKELLTIARQIPGAKAILCGKKQAYIEDTDTAFMTHVAQYYDRREVVDDLLAVTDDQFLKIAICDLAGSEANSYPYFKHLENSLQVKISGSVWLDLSHRLANKGRALEVVQKKFGISFDETIVFGDYLNDLEMMQQAYYSYAMENAHSEVKKASRFLAKSNDENGVIEILKQLVTSK